MPTIELRLWELREGTPLGTGPTRTLAFRPGSPAFQSGWEVLFDG